GILAAQARLLDAPRALDLDVAFAAHRLMRSDLCVACGHEMFGDPRSTPWWAIGPDDVALERAVAARAGVTADALPVVRHFARHELLRSTHDLNPDDAPSLHGYVAPLNRVALSRLGALVAERGRRVATDLRLGAHNIKRLPQFLERRMPGVARLWRVA